MLYVCIPVHDEAATVGVLLWRLRTVLQDAGRDYEVVVYDDASTDATAEVLAPYARVMPLTVLGGASAPRRGRTGATEALLRHVVATSRHPRRDACLVLQGDFTDRPEDVPALVAAFEAGADVVVGRREPDESQPPAERRLRRMGPWVLRPLVRVAGVDDLLGGARLMRVAVLRDLARARGGEPLVASGGWAGAAELLAETVPFARQVVVVDTPGRYDVRRRPSRLDWAAELRALARYAWRARGTHARPLVSGRSALASGPPIPNAGERFPTGSEQPGATERDEQAREERPRRARGARARREQAHDGQSSITPDPSQSGVTRSRSYRLETQPGREQSSREPSSRDASVAPGTPIPPLDFETAAERPRPRRARRRARGGDEAGAASADAAESGFQSESAHDDSAPPPHQDGGAPLDGPPPTGAALGDGPLTFEPSAVGPAAADEVQRARRRKRRPRRRGRGTELTGDAAEVGSPDHPNDAEARESGVRVPADPSDAAEDHGPSYEDLDDSEGASSPRGRRRRPRGRSGERSPGVSTETASNTPGSQGVHEAPVHGASSANSRPAATAPDVPPADS